MKRNRKRAPSSPIDLANRKTDEQFVTDYLSSDTPTNPSLWTTKWTHPQTNDIYTLTLASPANLNPSDLQSCFALIEETSRSDYENSAAKWRPSKKLKEMKSPELRYILVRHPTTLAIRGFTSLMPTYEEGQPVVYCYEIHLKDELKGTGLAALLMSFHTTVAKAIPPITKVMLTCFLSNQRGLNFYKKLGFETDDISPVPRNLRFAKVFTPDYVIMSKRVRPDP
ncbi:hypothetical protein B0T16DRAFT_409021 [Cercophora newfieldiana]|uniref:N-alpha-acetyltransferase 40 n=1 Tax=Cercophora newfieldiana TaxID=92897 RepID=A0AA40CTM9_9PEZI|nr:hypothetical protein B0T16DRAFT_409021 [Cercophora newfieldiana]